MRTPEFIQAAWKAKIIDIEQEELKGDDANANLLEIWRADKTNLEAELEASEAAQERIVKDVEVNGYIMDGLKSGDYTMAELAHTPEDYTLQAIAVQKWALEQKDAFDKALSELQSNLEIVSNDLKIQLEAKDELSRQLYQAKLSQADAEQKRDNISKLYTELQEQIKQQESESIPAIAPLTPEEQDAKWRAENAKLNSRIKVTSIRFADPTGIDTSKSIATLALGGEEEFPSIYKSRYIIISEAETMQLRNEYEQKKADIQLSNPSIVDSEYIEPLSELEEPVKVATFQETGHELGEGLSMDGEHASHEASEEAKESEVVTLELLKAELEALKAAHDITVARVDNIERNANIQAVA